MTKPLTKAQKQDLLDKEQGILQGLLKAKEMISTAEQPISVRHYDGSELFSFRVQPISVKATQRLTELATTYKTNRRGVKIVDKVDAQDLHARIIVEATHPEDREKIWNNKEIWSHFPNVLAPHHLVPEVMLGGAIDAAIEVIEELSGHRITAEDLAEKEAEEIDELKN